MEGSKNVEIAVSKIWAVWWAVKNSLSFLFLLVFSDWLCVIVLEENFRNIFVKSSFSETLSQVFKDVNVGVKGKR